MPSINYLFFFRMCFGKCKSPKPVKDPYNEKPIRDVNQEGSNLERIESFELTSKESLSSSPAFMGLRDLINDSVTIFSYRELCKATENFSPSRSIGTSVFKATVRNVNVVIAKKKWRVFHNILEKLKEACSVHHTSIAKLLGACFSEKEHLYLVYEYVEGFNLQLCLQKSRTTGFCVLDSWTKRLEVALDVAKGLEYLHDHTHSGFVHKYIRSSNVIIGNDLRGKIAMFAAVQLTGEVELALPRYVYLGEKPVGPDLLRSNSTKITGTPGYMAPEYISSGMITTKFDVFAFGVVLLELLSGREPLTFQYDDASQVYKKVSLPDSVLALINDPEPLRKLRLWIDPLFNDSYPVKSVYDVALVAKACIDADPENRPQMRDVAMKLSKALVKSQKWEKSMALTRNLQSNEMEGR